MDWKEQDFDPDGGGDRLDPVIALVAGVGERQSHLFLAMRLTGFPGKLALRSNARLGRIFDFQGVPLAESENLLTMQH